MENRCHRGHDPAKANALIGRHTVDASSLMNTPLLPSSVRRCKEVQLPCEYCSSRIPPFLPGCGYCRHGLAEPVAICRYVQRAALGCCGIVVLLQVCVFASLAFIRLPPYGRRGRLARPPSVDKAGTNGGGALPRGSACPAIAGRSNRPAPAAPEGITRIGAAGGTNHLGATTQNLRCVCQGRLAPKARGHVFSRHQPLGGSTVG